MQMQTQASEGLWDRWKFGATCHTLGLHRKACAQPVLFLL